MVGILFTAAPLATSLVPGTWRRRVQTGWKVCEMMSEDKENKALSPFFFFFSGDAVCIWGRDSLAATVAGSHRNQWNKTSPSFSCASAGWHYKEWRAKQKNQRGETPEEEWGLQETDIRMPWVAALRLPQRRDPTHNRPPGGGAEGSSGDLLSGWVFSFFFFF